MSEVMLSEENQSVSAVHHTSDQPAQNLFQRCHSMFSKLHRNEDGAVSLETVLIVGAIVIPILIFILKYAWPKISNYFNDGMSDLDSARDNVNQ
jgi:Flp pilus assembly pilin Flp